MREGKTKENRPGAVLSEFRKTAMARDSGLLLSVRLWDENLRAIRTAAAAAARHCSSRSLTMSRQRWRLPSISMNMGEVMMDARQKDCTVGKPKRDFGKGEVGFQACCRPWRRFTGIEHAKRHVPQQPALWALDAQTAYDGSSIPLPDSDAGRNRKRAPPIRIS